MTKEAIDEFIADLDEAEYESRILGNPRYLVGRVFPEWRPEMPYYIPEERIPPFWDRYCLIDPHPRKPVAVLWCAHDPETDTVIAYDELWDRHLKSVGEVAEAIHQKERKHREKYETFEARNVRVRTRIIDDSSEEHERTSGLSLRSEFRRHGIDTVLANKRNKFAGYNQIHEALRISELTKKPQLQIFTCCGETCKNFLKHVWDDWSSSPQRLSKGQKQDVKPKDDDFIACLRYFYQRGTAQSGGETFSFTIGERLSLGADRQSYARQIPGLWGG
jgi:hypothetical protein